MRSEWRFRHTLVSPDGFRRVLGQIKAEFPPNLLDACYLFGVGLRKSVAVLLFSRRRGPYQRTGELKQMRSPDFIVKIAADSIDQLRAVDVFRVLDNCSDEERKPMARAIVAAHPDRRYAVEIIGCWSEFADCSHIKDADCVVSPADDSCVICKVHHGDACMVCGGRGFHTEACSLNKANSQTGANILKRAIEHMCSGEWSEDRADALEILNVAIEECFAVESPSAPVPSSFASPGFDWQVSDSPTKGVAVVLSLTAAVAELVADALSAVEPSGDSPDVAEELACAITERLREQANQ